MTASHMHFYKRKVALNWWYAKCLGLSENLSAAYEAGDVQHSSSPAWRLYVLSQDASWQAVCVRLGTKPELLFKTAELMAPN